ncbi:hypothetical protein FQN54_000302 [Arachnomyces sp. PD_36]|nr:hypothetical protein FQN54_000302 [Arachnomyces sp. PD_36]
MGPNMSSPDCGSLPRRPTNNPPTHEEHSSQNSLLSSSSKHIDPEESTCLFDRLIDLCEAPSRSSYCDPSQVNLLIKLLENKVLSVEIADLSVAGSIPFNTLIDRPENNGDLVVSFLHPQDLPCSKENLLDWTRAILRETPPLGIISILSPEQSEDTLDLIQWAHTDSTGNQGSLWKKNSVVSFDCEVSWLPDPSRLHCVVYKIQYQTHHIAVLRVDEGSEEHKQHFPSDRASFAKAIVLPLVLSLRALSFKFTETELEAMENRDKAWWLPIVVERNRRSREQRASRVQQYQTHTTPLEEYRVFGSSSQSWLGGYEPSTFLPPVQQPRQHESSNTIQSTTTRSSTTHQSQDNAEAARARKAEKRKAKKKAKKEAKKAELESSIPQGEIPAIPTHPTEDSILPKQDIVAEGPASANGSDLPTSHDSLQLPVENISPNSLMADATVGMAQKQSSTDSTKQTGNSTLPTQTSTKTALAGKKKGKLVSQSPESALKGTGKTPTDPLSSKDQLKASDLKLTKPSSLGSKSSPEASSTKSNFPTTSTVPRDVITKPTNKAPTDLSEPSHDEPLETTQDHAPSTISSKLNNPSNTSSENPPIVHPAGSANDNPSQRSNKKRNKGKKGSGKPKDEAQKKVDGIQMQKPESTAVAPISANPTPAASTSLPDEPSQAKQTSTKPSIDLPSTSSKPSKTKQNLTGSTSLSVGKSSQAKQTSDSSIDLSSTSAKSSKVKQTSTESTSLPISKSSKSSQAKKKSASSDKSSIPLPAKSSDDKEPTLSRKPTETLSTPRDEQSKAKQTHASTDNLPKSSQLKKASSNLSTLSAPTSSSNLNGTTDTEKSNPSRKGERAELNISSQEPTFSDRASGDENGQKPASTSKSRLPSKNSDQELPLKDKAEEGKMKAESEANKSTSSKSNKRGKKARKRRNKEATGSDSVPGSETQPAPSDISPAKTQSSLSNASSDATSRAKPASTVPNPALESKPTSVSPATTSSDKPEPNAIPKIKITPADATVSQKTPKLYSEAEFPPLAPQEKSGSPSKKAPIAQGKGDQNTSNSSVGIGNKSSAKAPEKPVEKGKRASEPESTLQVPRSTSKTKTSGTAKTETAAPKAEIMRQEPFIVSSTSGTTSTRTPTNAPSSNPHTQGRQANQGFFWQLDSHGFPCAMEGCDKRCSSWDGASVICPKCGPYSEIRFCGKEHLFEGVKYHWLQCGTKTFKHPCRANTIPREQKEGPPVLPSLHDWDTPERFRQAVRHAADKSGDYFVFGDWQAWMAAGQPVNTVAVRCTTRVIYTVRFDDPVEQDRFRRVLGIALFNSLQCFELVGYLFRLIRGNALAKGQWSEELDLALQYQFNLEYGFAVGPWLGSRHACETEWTGANVRHCSDAVCRAERVQLLGDRGVGRGFQHLCEYMEASHWLLRAARRTHPSVTAVEERMRGEGFEGVVPGDRRVFRRGEGWDGFGTGDMEIEGVNVP